MNPKIEYLHLLFKVNTDLFNKALEMSANGDHFERPADKANSLHWVAGHLTNSRFTIAQMLGLKEEYEYDSLFSFGSEIKEIDAYPSLDEIKRSWEEISAKMLALFESVTDDHLASEAPFEVPGVPKRIGEMVAFLQLHDSYHVGQLAYINRLLGAERLVG
ncbi:MAG: DinB family protein [candidate division Zixibacteria bacterium]